MAASAAPSVGELSQDARDVIRTKTIEGSERLRHWIDLLRELADADERLDARRNRMKRFAIGFTVALFPTAFLTAFGAAALSGVAPRAVPLVFVPGACLVVADIVFICRFLGLKRVDLSNGFRETVLPVMEALSEDVPEKGKVKLSLDVGPVVRSSNRISRQNVPSRWRKLIETVYESPWCNVVAPLADGTKLMLGIVGRATSYERHYTSRSGKWKSKTKWKALVTVTAAILPGTAGLGWDAGKVGQRASKAKAKAKDNTKIKLAAKGEGEVCRLVRRFKAKGGKAELPSVEPGEVVNMLMQLCSMLKTSAGERGQS